MLTLNSIVDVRVNVAPVSASGTGFSTGLILAPASGASVTETQRLRLFASAADLLADPSGDFTAASPAYLAAKSYFAADPAPDQVYVSLYPASESLPDALDAVLNLSADFYGVYAAESDSVSPSASTERILALARHLETLHAHLVLFCGATGTVAEAVSASGLLHGLFDLSASRAVPIYGADAYAPAALMGTAMGLARASASAPFTLCYKEIPGMLPTSLTESELAALHALNANAYIVRGLSRRLLEKGTVSSGLRFDEVYAMDRIAADLQEAALSLLTAGASRLPQTDETSAVFINRFSAILADYASGGYLATAPWRGESLPSLQPGDTVENGYLLWADSYDLQSDADRRAHKAMPIHIALCLAGSAESLVINIDVTT